MEWSSNLSVGVPCRSSTKGAREEFGLAKDNIKQIEKTGQNIGAYRGVEDNPLERWIVNIRSQSVNMAETQSA